MDGKKFFLGLFQNVAALAKNVDMKNAPERVEQIQAYITMINLCLDDIESNKKKNERNKKKKRKIVDE